MSHFDDQVDGFLELLCECQPYFKCEWHKRLSAGEDRKDIEREMRDSLFDSHLRWAIEQGFVDPEQD